MNLKPITDPDPALVKTVLAAAEAQDRRLRAEDKPQPAIPSTAPKSRA
jgi:hypothetical protein